MTLSAATYTRAGELLRALETNFGDAAAWAGDVTTALETKFGEISEAWFGDYPDQHHEQATTYLAEMKPLVDCCTSAVGTIGGWAAIAEQSASDVAGYEQAIAMLGSAPFDPVEVDDQISAARQSKAAVAEAWHGVCRTRAETLSSAITALEACATALAVPVAERTVAPGGDYTVLTVALAHLADLPLSWVDPSGGLQDQADAALSDFLAGGNADLMYVVMETANDGNILASDDKLTRSDLEAATDPTTVRGLLLAWGRATNTEFSEADLSMLTASIVASAWMMLGSDNDDWKDVDDTLAPEAELTSVLGDQAVEAYVSSGSNSLLGPYGTMPADPAEAFIWAGGGAQMPADVDSAIATHTLDLYVNGPTPVEPSIMDSWDTPGDWFRNVVFEEIGLPDEGDVLQRLVPVGQSELILENIATGHPTTVVGFVAPANDVVQFSTPAEVFDGVGLGYVDRSGMMSFSPDADVVRAIRFPATADVLDATDIPRVADLGGSGAYDEGYGWPFTGNGFVSSPDAVVPELRIESPVAMPEGAEMWEIGADGTQRLVGVYQDGRWVRIGD